MTRLLRLFAAFRALESDRDATVLELRAALQEETTQKLILQDRLDNVLADRSAIWEMTKEAINEERSTLKMMANYRIQSVFGVTPYPEANQLPQSAEADLESDPVVHRRRLPSEAISAARNKLVNELTDRILKRPA